MTGRALPSTTTPELAQTDSQNVRAARLSPPAASQASPSLHLIVHVCTLHLNISLFLHISFDMHMCAHNHMDSCQGDGAPALAPKKSWQQSEQIAAAQAMFQLRLNS